MVMSSVLGLKVAAMRVTSPIFTPRNSTGEPTDRPVIAPLKNMTYVVRRWKSLPDPKTATAATASARPPRTNAPMSALRGSLAMAGPFTPGQECEHPGIARLGQQPLGITAGDHGRAPGVEKDRVVADGEDARQLVRHRHDRGAEAV